MAELSVPASANHEGGDARDLVSAVVAHDPGEVFLPLRGEQIAPRRDRRRVRQIRPFREKNRGTPFGAAASSEEKASQEMIGAETCDGAEKHRLLRRGKKSARLEGIRASPGELRRAGAYQTNSIFSHIPIKSDVRPASQKDADQYYHHKRKEKGHIERKALKPAELVEQHPYGRDEDLRRPHEKTDEGAVLVHRQPAHDRAAKHEDLDDKEEYPHGIFH